MTAFHNKSVLVLGGSRGIGAAIVRRFVADGASVVFSYSGSPQAAERLAAETGSTAVQADSADRDAVSRSRCGDKPGPRQRPAGRVSGQCRDRAFR